MTDDTADHANLMSRLPADLQHRCALTLRGLTNAIDYLVTAAELSADERAH